MKVRIIVIAAIASLMTWNANAAPWRRVPVPGGAIEDLAVLADGRLYAGTTDGLYRSDDAGDHWTRAELMPSYKKFHKVHPVDGSGDRLVAYTETLGRYDSLALELSTDGGTTWRVTLSDSLFWGNTGTSAGRFISHPVNRDVILFAEYVRLRRSEDGGQTWRTVDDRSNWSELFAIPDAVGRFVAHSPGVNLQFLESTDGGLTWILHDLTPPLRRHGRAHVVQDALQPERLYFSIFRAYIDGNEVSTSGWVDTRDWSVTLFSDPCDCHRRVVPDPHRPGRLLAPSTTLAPDTAAITGYPIRESLDGGATWQTLSSLERQIDTEFRLVFDPSTPGRSYMPSLGAGVYRSDDGGITWNPHHAGMTGGTILNVSVNPSDPAEFVVARRLLPMLHTKDGGTSFQAVEADFYSELYSAHPQRIARSRADHRLMIGYGTESFYKSQDGGVTWTPLASDYPFDANVPNSITFIGDDSTHLVTFTYAPESRMTYWSSDGGAHWLPVAVPNDTNMAFQDLQTHRETNRVYLAYEYGAVTPYGLPGSGALYLASQGAALPFHPIAVPTDFPDGSSWAPSRPDPNNWRRRLLKESNVLLGANPVRTWETTDDGANWKILGPGPINSYSGAWSIDACDGRTVWEPNSGSISRDNGLTFRSDVDATPTKLGRFENLCLDGKTHAVAVMGEGGLGAGLLIREPEAGDTLLREAFDP
ncbi:sialidase family protein [Dokdonella koreensis]|uniref:Glycosyl hydrolase, BNR repeat-containing protein n=1 Tax=Dokdonella koreensis DS-123 TaxID=1300342 RepID=A0A160DXL6_9GAMM|nr:sialidase family protein [Dokdonella koreensis]ANB19284.1 Glycosyl hydrolase, BNR repeat-containing protein [Dokdonella koreensis DS-123]